MGYKDKEKQKAYQREWMQRRRLEYFAGKTCVACGSKENLELDHKDPALKASHRIWSYTKIKRELELAKCQPLCRGCHWEKTKRDFNYGLKHGTDQGYHHYSCRCVPCKAAHGLHMAKYRANLRSVGGLGIEVVPCLPKAERPVRVG